MSQRIVTHFSFLVPLAGDASWVAELWPLLAAADSPERLDHPIFGTDGVTGLPEVEHQPAGLWFHDVDGGCSDIDDTVAVVQWVLQHPGTPATIRFEWAETCSTPEVDSFSGGAALVSADAAATLHTSATTVSELLAGDLADQHADLL